MPLTASSPPVMSKRQLLLLVLILGVAFSLRMVFLYEPLERDEGLYAYIGQEILRGGLPYRDAMDQKPPGIHYIYAAGIAVFGATPEGIRTGTAVYSIGTVLAVFFCSLRVFGVRAALWSAGLYAVFSAGPLIRGSSSNSEVFMVLPIVASFYCIIAWFRRQTLLLLAASGLLLGCALAIKTVALPHIIAALIFILIPAVGTRTWIKTVRDGMLFSVSAAVPLLATALFFHCRGAFDDYYYWTIEFNKMYGQTTPAVFFNRMRLGLTRTVPELLPLAVLAVPALFLKGSRKTWAGLFLLASLPAAFMGVSMPTKFHEHYFIQLVPPLALLAGAGMAFLLERRKAVLLPALVPFAAAIVFWAARDYKFFLTYSPEEVSSRKYANDVFVHSANIARYIKERTAPDDYIFQWGFQPEIYFLSGRRSPNLYTVHFAVAASRDQRQASLDLGRSLILKHPVYIVVQQGRSMYPGFDVVQEILARYYRLETELGGSQLWRAL